jgi:hypothetical protein
LGLLKARRKDRCLVEVDGVGRLAEELQLAEVR